MPDTPSKPVNQKNLLRSDLPFPVVGIGASAGGIEALKTFFKHMPAEPGMAFVVVLHLSPHHESMLDRILQSTTSMPVLAVTRSVPVQCNHVYVIPPGVSLSMNDGYLRLTRAARPHGQHIAIDVFFRTLADVHQARAVGIVLTGGGADGSIGIARIKEQGGVTFAQQPEDAAHDTMPRSAIATGMVDIVLPVAEIPARLLEFAANQARIHIPAPIDQEVHPRADAAADETPADRNALHDILGLLRARTGHDFRHYKRATVLRRIERRMQVTGVPDMTAYAAMLRETADETPKLLSDMLIGVTQFFRDRDAFQALEHLVVPALFNRGSRGERAATVRAWVAGCSTGEEAYSLAMLLSDEAERLAAPTKIQVFATDIDAHALAAGRTGLYPQAIETDVAAARLHTYFTKEDASYRVKKEIREKVLFAPHNILHDPPFSKLDLVTCRNLLIYLDREVQADVLRMFHFALNPGGYLFLGSSESADACENLFKVVDKRNCLYQARDAASLPRAIRMHAAAPFDKIPPAPVDAAAGRRGKPSFAELHRRALEQYAPPSVVVDLEGNIVHMSERAGRYLRYVGGEPSRSLASLVHPELRMELRTALFQALHSRKSIEARRVALSMGERRVYVNIVVRPFSDAETGGDFVLVIFDEVEDVLDQTSAVRGPHPEQSVLTQIEAELRQTKEQLQLTMEQSETSTEELKASNEELQAINEELRSATEELETGKEELQSVNEELITVNAELKSKVEETAKINDDLQNLIASTDIATVFVDRSMRIKWFTPRAADIFSVITSDAGRSLLDITHRLDYADLARDAAGVFESLRPIEREVCSIDGRWYLARLLPYRSSEHRIDGAVLTFIDITDRRKAEERMRLGEAHMKLVAESAKDFAIMTIGPDGTIVTWSYGAELMFGYTEAEAIGQSIAIIFTQEDIEAGAPAQEMERARHNGYAPDERWHRRKDGTRIFCTGGVNPMEDSTFRGYAKITRDVTEQKRRDHERETTLERTRADNVQKDAFFAVMSHELKHPLNLVQLNTELLLRIPEINASRPARRAAEAIQRSVQGQARIIEDLLDLSRVRTGKLKLNRGVVNLTATVQSIVDVLAPLAADVGVALQPLYDASQPLNIDADPVRIEQIVWNLVNNGIKFTPSGGTVTVGLCRDGEMARLDVRDTGDGIDPAFLPKIFDMFTQGQARLHGQRRDGLGIGLAIVHQLVLAHGGRIEAASEGAGRGALFTVWLAGATAQPEADAAGASAAQGQLANVRILVVDDSDEVLETFQALLEMEGAVVQAYDNGAAALAALGHAEFDLIISDIAMPGIDGYQLLRAVRERLPDTPAIALTGHSSKDDVERAMRAGFSTHLSKPVPMTALLETVSRILQWS